MAVVIGIAGEGDVVLVLEADEPPHCIRRGRVHPDFPVPVQGHEGECGIDHFVHHVKIDPEALRNAGPVVHAGAAQRIDPHAHARTADHIQVDHVRQVVHIARQIIVGVGRGRAPRTGKVHPCHAGEAGFDEGIGPRFDPRGHFGVGGAAVGRVVLESAAVGRVVGGRDHDSVRKAGGASTVVGQDGMGHGRRRCVFVVRGRHDLHAVRGEDFDRGGERGRGEGVRVESQKQRPVDALLSAVIADRLSDRQDVRLVEARVERAAAMSGGTEGDALRGDARVGPRL